MDEPAPLVLADLSLVRDPLLAEMHATAVIGRSTSLLVWEMSLRLGEDNAITLQAQRAATDWGRLLRHVHQEQRRRA